MTKTRDKRGRPKGSRNRGYFYRDSRGWFTKDTAGRFVPLADEDGEQLRDQHTPESAIKLAYARYLTSQKPKPSANGVTLLEVCDRYLAFAEKTAAATTIDCRRRTLFDLCYGLGMMRPPDSSRNWMPNLIAANGV